MSDRSGITVVAAPWSAGSPRLVSRAREMANSLGCYLRVVTDAAHAADAGASGADEVRTDDAVCAGKLGRWDAQALNEVFLFEDTPAAALTAGRLAGRTGAPTLEGVVSVDFDLNERLLLMRIETFGGKQLEEWVGTSLPVIALVKADRLPEPMPGYGRDPEVKPLA